MKTHESAGATQESASHESGVPLRPRGTGDAAERETRGRPGRAGESYDMLARFSVFLILTLITAMPVLAIEPTVSERWVSTLERTAGMLLRGSHKEALQKLQKLTSEILESSLPQDDSACLLLVPLLQMAVAEAGSGDHDSALWHWHMAQTLYPDTIMPDVSGYGKLASILTKNMLTPRRFEACPEPDEEVTQPVILKAAKPAYPETARRWAERGLLIVSFKVDADGTVREPRLVKPLPVPLAYAALEAIRSMRFLPATNDGRAVSSDFCLSVHFVLE
jgi:TonB family protein